MDSRPLDPCTLMHRFASIGQEGWLATVCLYETWHNLATLNLLGGANLKSVTKTLAHSDVAFTLR